MSANKECQKLASELSNNFRNTDPFIPDVNSFGNDPSTRLADYLWTHGLLLTMCLTSCSLGLGADHVSGSWINAKLGGTRVIPTATGVGLLLDPTIAKVNCIYPTDAGSSSRDNNGCGPEQMDPVHGSKGAASYPDEASKKEIRAYYNEYKVLNFGNDTKWTDIECNQFFNTPMFTSDTWHLDDTDQKPQFATLPSVLQEQVEAIMGHPVCTAKAKARIHMAIYTGAESWRPEKFQEAIDLQMKFINNPTSLVPFLFNELVIDLPRQLKDIVKGVFYLEDDPTDMYRQRFAMAHAEAKLFGNVPVFKLNNDPGIEDQDILTCADDETPKTREESFFRQGAPRRSQEQTFLPWEFHRRQLSRLPH